MFGACYNVSAAFENQASSMTFQQAHNCTLYHGLGCTGSSVVVTSTEARIKLAEFSEIAFNDMLASFCLLFLGIFAWIWVLAEEGVLPYGKDFNLSEGFGLESDVLFWCF
jgi:hypothetical protein